MSKGAQKYKNKISVLFYHGEQLPMKKLSEKSTKNANHSKYQSTISNNFVLTYSLVVKSAAILFYDENVLNIIK